jgi:hypothetical protein
MIRGIGTAGDHFGARRGGGIEHPVSHCAHARQAHLREKVEVVFVKGNQARAIEVQRLRKPLARILEHRIKQGHGEPVHPEQSCRIECSQRGIRLHFANLLRIVEEMVRVREQNVYQEVTSNDFPSESPPAVLVSSSPARNLAQILSSTTQAALGVEARRDSSLRPERHLPTTVLNTLLACCGSGPVPSGVTAGLPSAP